MLNDNGAYDKDYDDNDITNDKIKVKVFLFFLFI